jgi:hypothetical protein
MRVGFRRTGWPLYGINLVLTNKSCLTKDITYLDVYLGQHLDGPRTPGISESEAFEGLHEVFYNSAVNRRSPVGICVRDEQHISAWVRQFWGPLNCSKPDRHMTPLRPLWSASNERVLRRAQNLSMKLGIHQSNVQALNAWAVHELARHYILTTATSP